MTHTTYQQCSFQIVFLASRHLRSRLCWADEHQANRGNTNTLSLVCWYTAVILMSAAALSASHHWIYTGAFKGLLPALYEPASKYKVQSSLQVHLNSHNLITTLDCGLLPPIAFSFSLCPWKRKKHILIVKCLKTYPCFFSLFSL